MIDIRQLLPYYPKSIADNADFHKHILKEYVELIALQHLTQSPSAPKLVFIGGTCLRLVHGIDRFSEDLDFDCTNLSLDEFMRITDTLIDHLRGNGLMVEARDKENTRLTAFRRNIYFPGLLFELHLTGHREERFLMKIEVQDQGVTYTPETAIVNRNGFLFPVSVPSKAVLLSMKLSALLARAKGRDFYDTIFLWQQTEPDYEFLSKRRKISTPQELKTALNEKLSKINLSDKQKDFQHLLFAGSSGNKILLFKDFLEEKTS
jgi:predicted nucleotidyltransferase component of viral defense system